MIVLFCDYGFAGPYLGQIEAILFSTAAEQKVITLFADAPAHNPRASAYLLAAYCLSFPADTVFFCVVDPGVGGETDRPVAILAGNHWFVGPDNGLFDVLIRRTSAAQVFVLSTQNLALSNSFHGRDLYAPVCAMLSRGDAVPGEAIIWEDQRHWPDDLSEIIYIDNFGNAITGIRGNKLPQGRKIRVAGKQIGYARTFSVAQTGTPFWYENGNGLVEIAVTRGSAALQLGLEIGTPLDLL